MTDLWLLERDEKFVDELKVRLAAEIGNVRVFATDIELRDAAQDCELGVVVVNTEVDTFDSGALFKDLRTIDPCAFVFAIGDRALGAKAVFSIESGADDSFSKNSDMALIEAKIRRALRRRKRCWDCNVSLAASRDAGHRVPTPASIVIDTRMLTRTEERIFALLCRNVGCTISTNAIVRDVWGHSDIDRKLLYEHISGLRAKLNEIGWTISSKRGVGYELRSLDGHHHAESTKGTS